MTAVTEVGPLPGDHPCREVPISPSSVPAGFPSPSQDYYDSGIDLNKHLIMDETSTFIVRVSGDSMTGAGISDGDELIVDRSLQPRDGNVVVAILDGELTVKRLRLDGSRVVLHPENGDYPDIEIPELSDLMVWGVATRCLHRL